MLYLAGYVFKENEMKQYITVEEARTQLSGRAFETAIVWIEEHNYRDWFNKDGYP